MGAELIALSDMFDYAYTLAEELRYFIISKDAPVCLFTERKTLFDVICKSNRRSQQRLILDTACAWEGFNNRKILNIGFLLAEEYIADGLSESQSKFIKAPFWER